MIYALLVGIEYATVDEIHQLFISDRAGNIVDIGIDSIGLSIGICFAMIIYKIVTNLLEKKKEGVEY